MDFCFNLVAIFLILDVLSIQYTDGTSKNSDFAGNPFLQPSAKALPSAQIQNPFLSGNINKNGNPFLSNNLASSTSNIASSTIYNPFPQSMNNPFLNPVRSNIEVSVSSSSPRPTQRTYTYYTTSSPYYHATSPPYYHTTSPPYYHTTSPPYHVTAPIPIFTTSAPDRIEFPTSYIPSEVHLPDSHFPLEDLLKENIMKTISERKCDEYVGEIVGSIPITTLTGSSAGVIRVKNVCENNNPLVVGGTDAPIGEFPHMVALGRRPNSEFILMCGGTLISHTWVLSAAHCTYGPEGGPTHARMGFFSLKDQEGITVIIKTTIRHPAYKAPAMYEDIALVQLVDRVTFTTNIRPACLYQNYGNVPPKAWVSGWGVTAYSGDISDHLQKVELDLIDNLFCTIRHNSSTEIPNGIRTNMICAGDPRGNWTKDSCQGDSGGPLQIYPKNKCLFQVIGITSFGQGCALIDMPGVYTRVSHYIPWIENIVWPQRH